MSSRSKLSSICWNNYIKGQIASSNFEGRSTVYMELKENERRVWSVDFSWSNPTLFPSDTGYTLAFGLAGHRVYYYDLRNPGVPLYTLTGHNKTVSYVKFLDSLTLVSSSTDNTLKL
ncbi:putative transcription factor WD40-like family [Helianthus anomalus]